MSEIQSVRCVFCGSVDIPDLTPEEWKRQPGGPYYRTSCPKCDWWIIGKVVEGRFVSLFGQPYWEG